MNDQKDVTTNRKVARLNISTACPCNLCQGPERITSDHVGCFTIVKMRRFAQTLTVGQEEPCACQSQSEVISHTTGFNVVSKKMLEWPERCFKARDLVHVLKRRVARWMED